MDGELKIDPSSTDDPARFEELPFVFLGAQPHRVTRHPVASVRYQQTKRGVTVILGVEGIEDRDDAEAVAKFKVFATEEALELGEDELFAHELVGWTVVTEDDTILGTVANLMEMPAQDMFVIRTPDDEEKMIPAVEDFVLAIDEEEEQVVVRPIDGLMGE
jgi:16S rRNA processing protein RimM